MPHLTEDTFARLAKPKLGASWKRALDVFRQYGSDWAFDVMLALLYAAAQGKVDDVLDRLDAYYNRHEKFLTSDFTRDVFDNIREKTLGLPPMRTSSSSS